MTVNTGRQTSAERRPLATLRVARTVADAIGAWAARTPDAPAVVAGSRMVTYGDLDGAANRLAHELCARGAGPGVVVGLWVDRSPEMIAGALAIWRAGAAYLPLDASYPPERLSLVASDARSAMVLFDSHAGEPCRVGVQSTWPIRLDGAELRERSGAPHDRYAPGTPAAMAAPPGHAQASDLAYVIYTSGSTGRPKGVEITHASLKNLVGWHNRTFGIRPSDRASHVAAVGFDASVWEIWPYLAAGASVHIAEDAVRTDPRALRDWILARELTMSFAPTPMAERLLALGWPRPCRLRFLLTGGDTLHNVPPPGLPFVLVNNYGPTECTVVSTSGTVDPYDQSDGRPSIGRPIDGVVAYVLDGDLQETPAGAAGELYIGGAGVARGYRGQPELTAERFVPDPFRAGARLYRTGDLAKRLPDGRIAFLGRTDDQVKIRGYRIEPAEIVAALNRCPGVAASAVVAEPIGGDQRRLVAYVVPADARRPPTRRQLQEALGSRLPEHMVPGTFVRLDALPLGVHGKVDRSALPEAVPANTLRDDPGRPPSSEVEQGLCALVEALLGIADVAMDDNFFLLGGHSLLGTQLIARIHGAFGVEMTLRDVFEAPTIAQLSRRVEDRLLAEIETMGLTETGRGPGAPAGAAGWP